MSDHETVWRDEAIATAWDAWQAYTEADTPLLQAQFLVDLSNAMSDLASWHTYWDYDKGEIREPGAEST